MRNFGALLLLLCTVGFFYASSKLSEVEPLPSDIGVRQSLDYPAGRWEMARFGFAAGAGIGLVLALFVRDR